MNEEDVSFEVAPSKEEMNQEKADAYEVHKLAVVSEHAWIIDYDFDSTGFLNCTVTLSVKYLSSNRLCPLANSFLVSRFRCLLKKWICQVL